MKLNKTLKLFLETSVIAFLFFVTLFIQTNELVFAQTAGECLDACYATYGYSCSQDLRGCAHNCGYSMCNPEPYCGDGSCNGSEDYNSCPSECSPPQMYGSLAPYSSSCTISAGASSCTSGVLSWYTTDPQGTSSVTNNGTATPASPSGNNSSSAFTVPYRTASSGVTTFYLYNNAVQLASATVTTSCAVGSTWNGTTCATNLVPTLSSPTVSSITTGGATLGANVTSLGSPASITARGTCWGTSPAPSTNCTAQGGTTTGAFTHARTGMNPNTLYYYRGYATNSTGTGYSADGTFTTTALTMSGTLTPSSSSCTISAGGSSCTSGTLTWTTTNPQATSAVTNNGSATPASPSGNNSSSAFSVPYTGGATTFYLYNNSVQLATATVTASCAGGTTWNGSTCATDLVPTLSSPTVSSITTGGATLGANVTSLGSPASITARGTCWGTSPAPSTNCTAQGGTTTGAFTHARTGMNPNTLYYYRGYATNSTGTGYSADGTFTTTALTMSGTLTPSSSSCTISAGGSSCTSGTLTWTTTNPQATSAVTNNGSATPASPSGNNSSSAFSVPYTGGATTFYLYNNAVQLASATVTTSCAVGSTWNGSTCATNVYTVTGSAGANGTISPATRSVNHGSTTTFTVTPNSGYTASASGCSGSLVGTTYTTGAITANCTVTATFTAGTFTVTPSAGANGTISPNTPQSVSGGTTRAFTVTPNSGYIASVSGTCGGSPASGSSAFTYTTSTITANCTVIATFTQMTGTLTPASSSCTIAAGASSCTSSTLTWTTTNPIATSAVTNNGTATPASPSGNNSSSAFSVPYTGGATTFYLYNNSVQLATATVTASCAGGTTWNGSTCATDLVPTLSSPTVSSITTGGATLGANVTSLGSPASITARGTCWGTTTNPTTNCTAQGGTTTGAFTHARTGMNPNTLYYYRGYATNSTGTGYSVDGTFTTAPTLVAPTVTTVAPSNITTNSATGSGNVTSNGGSTVTVSGVVWSTSINPTTALSTKTTDGWALGGPWTGCCSMTGLSSNTLYHVRAYATNSVGTSYGNDLTFTTGSLTAPSVTTVAPSNITTNSATGSGNVTSNGGSAVTVSGVVWSTSVNPTTALSTKTTDGWALGGPWTSCCNMTGLASSTVYHVRAYATNSVGTAYGSDMQFTTGIPVPDINTFSITPTSGIVGLVSPTITWGSVTNNPTSCTAGGDWSGSKSVSGGSQALGVLDTIKTYTFTLTCSNVSGPSTPESVAIVVVDPVPTTADLSTDLSSNPPSIYSGDSFTLNWDSNAASCTGTNFDTGGVPSGSVELAPLVTTTYSMNCEGEESTPLTITVKKKPTIIEN